uniref:Uncharacterized protein n=1 Tax=Tanacetum cinerariifolium TaxID=118510 RepID=A0A699J503_TANCI|nr:hypothetical protein [Tanacetum cinerariifolium]
MVSCHEFILVKISNLSYFSCGFYNHGHGSTAAAIINTTTPLPSSSLPSPLHYNRHPATNIILTITTATLAVSALRGALRGFSWMRSSFRVRLDRGLAPQVRLVGQIRTEGAFG